MIENEARLTVVIPCFNEADNLEKLIRDLEVEISKNRFKVVLVDNGSTDHSQDVLARSLGKCNENISKDIRVIHLLKNQNYGGGIKAGIFSCDTEYVGWFHADLQFHASEISKLMTGMRSHATLIKGLRQSRSSIERVFTGGMSILSTILFQRFCRDINGQPTLYRRDFLTKCNDAPDDFSLDAYFYLKAVLNRESIIRYPVKMTPRLNGVSSWNVGFKSQLRFSYRMVKALFKIRIAKNA